MKLTELEELVKKIFRYEAMDGIKRKGDEIWVHMFNWNDVLIDKFSFYIVIDGSEVEDNRISMTPTCHIGSVDGLITSKKTTVRSLDKATLIVFRDKAISDMYSLRDIIDKMHKTPMGHGDIVSWSMRQINKLPKSKRNRVLKAFNGELTKVYKGAEERQLAGILALCMTADREELKITDSQKDRMLTILS